MLKNFNIFRSPLSKELLEDWAKLTLDCAKVAILAIPVLIYGGENVFNKIVYTIVLVMASYFLLFISRICRDMKRQKEGE